jgi:hypothetical protein
MYYFKCVNELVCVGVAEAGHEHNDKMELVVDKVRQFQRFYDWAHSVSGGCKGFLA